MKTICAIHTEGPLFYNLGKIAARSFLKFHPDIPVATLGTEESKRRARGEDKYIFAKRLMEKHKAKRVICLGADTITCARLTEFLEAEEDIIGSLNYDFPYECKFYENTENTPNINSDVSCFTSLEALSAIIENSGNHGVYREMGALNQVCWSNAFNFSVRVVDFPYETSKVVYNVRSKGTVAKPGEKPWGPYLQKFYTKDEKLYTGEGKQIKVWHYCDALGGISPKEVQNLFENYRTKWFNKETLSYFKNICDAIVPRIVL